MSAARKAEKAPLQPKCRCGTRKNSPQHKYDHAEYLNQRRGYPLGWK